jgi:hypothetical protein
MFRRRLDGPALIALLLAAGCSSSTSTNAGAQGGKGASSGSGADSAIDSGSGADGSGQGGNGTGTGANAGQDGGATNGTGAGGAAGSTGSAGAAGSIGKIPVGSTQCSDGKDNDGDGLVDSADPECTGPLDNDESSFATGIPGDNVDPKWQDCFFDGNSGGGDDGCRYSTKCLTGELDPSSKDCQVSDACRKFCMPLTPNGCDCFGCCEVKGADGGIAHVSITSTCTYADIGDPKKCPTCEPSPACDNTCDHCELCLGKSTLPADCAPSTGGAGGVTGSGGMADTGGSGGAVASGGAGGACVAPLCEPGRQSCGVACLPDCAAGSYCLTGCCVPSVR